MQIEKMIGQIVLIQPNTVVYVLDKVRQSKMDGTINQINDNYMGVDITAHFHIIEPGKLIRLANPGEVSAIKKSLDAINFFI